MSEGVRVPGLPEGLEIVGIYLKGEQSPPDLGLTSYILTGDGHLYPNAALGGHLIVRSLPGYEIKWDGERNVVEKILTLDLRSLLIAKFKADAAELGIAISEVVLANVFDRMNSPTAMLNYDGTVSDPIRCRARIEAEVRKVWSPILDYCPNIKVEDFERLMIAEIDRRMAQEG